MSFDQGGPLGAPPTPPLDLNNPPLPEEIEIDVSDFAEPVEEQRFAPPTNETGGNELELDTPYPERHGNSGSTYERITRMSGMLTEMVGGHDPKMMAILSARNIDLEEAKRLTRENAATIVGEAVKTFEEHIGAFAATRSDAQQPEREEMQRRLLLISTQRFLTTYEKDLIRKKLDRSAGR